MQAYQVADATGMVKLDAMENPYRLPAALRREIGRRRLARGAEPLSRCPPRSELRALIREVMQVPAGCDDPARQRLGRAASRSSPRRSRARARW